MTRKVAVILGSLRAASWSRKLARSLIALAPDSLQAEIVEIGDLPLYNQDLDDTGNPPPAWTAFRDQVKVCDAVLFVTPEYNRSVPAPLKNALDVGSRPFGKNVWDGKPGAVVSVSPGAIGAFGANHHLRQALVYLNVPCLQMPEAYIGSIANRFDAMGVLSDRDTYGSLLEFMTAYADWVARNARSDGNAAPAREARRSNSSLQLA